VDRGEGEEASPEKTNTDGSADKAKNRGRPTSGLFRFTLVAKRVNRTSSFNFEAKRNWYYGRTEGWGGSGGHRKCITPDGCAILLSFPSNYGGEKIQGCKERSDGTAESKAQFLVRIDALRIETLGRIYGEQWVDKGKPQRIVTFPIVEKGKRGGGFIKGAR